MTSTDPAWLDLMYNNRARVPEHGAIFARWAEQSAAIRQAGPAAIDLPYGVGPNETLDVFPAAKAKGRARAAAKAPVLVFIHGGYWRSLDKSEHSFVAPPFVEQGICVIVPNYALCPGTPAQPVGVEDIALQMVRALVWTWRHIAEHGGDPERITVSGHSAGGHLAAMLLACDWQAVAPDLPAGLVRKALSISGLFDLRPIQQAPFLGPFLNLHEAEAPRLSPALWSAPSAGSLYTLAGGNESEEFLRQNQQIREAWGAARVPVCEALPGLHHFDIVDALADPAHRLHRLALELIGS